MMKFEHFALNVPDARTQARWYVEHFGLVIVRKREEAPRTYFLADDSGRVVVGFYTDATRPFMDFPEDHPAPFHFSVVAKKAITEGRRLEKAGAKLLIEEIWLDSTNLVMRDPWNLPIEVSEHSRRSEPASA